MEYREVAHRVYVDDDGVRWICDRLRRSIERVRDPQAAADRRMDEILAGYEDEWRRERARELS